MKRLRILLADDHSQILTLLKIMLEPTFHVVGTVEDGQSLIAAGQALRPDLVLTDIDMPIRNGIEATRELRKLQPQCRVIFHSSHDQPDIVAAAFAAGASGYVIKGSARDLVSSIRSVIDAVVATEEAAERSKSADVIPHDDNAADRPSVSSL